jgi:hypothetical protein
MLVKTKTRSGATIQGLSRDDSGGIIETLISMKSRKGAVDPSHPSQPSQNTDKPSTVSNSATMDTVTGEMVCDGCVTGETVHPSQPGTTTPQASQPFINPSVTGVMGKPEKLRDEEKNKLIQDSSSPPLLDRMLEVLKEPFKLGELVLSRFVSESELHLAALQCTPEQIADIKDAANGAWHPGLNRDADYKGERVEIFEAGQSKDIRIKTQSGTFLKVKRGNLRPWLGVLFL